MKKRATLSSCFPDLDYCLLNSTNFRRVYEKKIRGEAGDLGSLARLAICVFFR